MSSILGAPEVFPVLWELQEYFRGSKGPSVIFQGLKGLQEGVFKGFLGYCKGSIVSFRTYFRDLFDKCFWFVLYLRVFKYSI